MLGVFEVSVTGNWAELVAEDENAAALPNKGLIGSKRSGKVIT
jgi:hypothetical protein